MPHGVRLTTAVVDYQEHLKGDYWRAVRNIALQVAGGQCSLCRAATALEVHHNSYDNLGAETLEDVVVLCRDCHGRHHRGERSPQDPILLVDGPDLMSDEDRATAERISREVLR